MAMNLTFNPPLTGQTTIPVATDGTVRLHLTATFRSRDAYERARAENLAIEMWTDLPAGSNRDQWHALRFQYAGDAVEKKVEDNVGKLISLMPLAQTGTPDDANRALHLELSLRDVHVGSSFSFTYRLVRSSGAIEWLGSYGRNGALVFEGGDDRLAWAEGWTLRGDEAAAESNDGKEEKLVAVLNRKIEWNCWAFGEHGWPTLSDVKTVPSSPFRTAVLIPRRPYTSAIVPQPLLLSVSGANSSLSIDETGRVFAERAEVVLVRTLDMQNAPAILANTLPESSRVLAFGPDARYIVVSTPSDKDVTFPIALSLIPLALQEEGPHDLVLRNVDLRTITPTIENSDVVLIGPSMTTFCFLGPEAAEDVIIRMDRSGGQLLLSELHALTSPETSPWKLAMLSPTASALVEMMEKFDNAPSALPTPPPSPPPTITSMRPASRDTSLETGPPLSIPSYQSFQSLAESFDSDAETVVPLSPTSITSEGKPEIVVEGESESAENVVPTSLELTTPPRTVLNDGLLRFFFAWFIRAFLARVWGLVDTGRRWFGFPSIYNPQGHYGSIGQQGNGVQTNRPGTTLGTVLAQRTRELSSQLNSPTADPGEDAAASSQGEEAESTVKETPEPTDHSPHKPLPFPPAIISPGVRRLKPRFLADVRSNIVSFLVHVPHVEAKPSDLAISINEQRVESSQGYSCSQLSGDVYLLGLQGPEGGSKVEVALD